MRVIAGSAKGRPLSSPPGTHTRPTTDRVKEALFSILMPDLPGAQVLDLYAGSGALGIEALSRGAEQATFVERHGRTAAVVRKNLQTCGLDARAEVIVSDAATWLRTSGPSSAVDVVVADPPYDTPPDELADVLDLLVQHLAPDAVVAIELGRRSDDPRWSARLRAREPRRYGDTVLHLARCEADVRPEGPE